MSERYKRINPMEKEYTKKNARDVVNSYSHYEHRPKGMQHQIIDDLRREMSIEVFRAATPSERYIVAYKYAFIIDELYTLFFKPLHLRHNDEFSHLR